MKRILLAILAALAAIMPRSIAGRLLFWFLVIALIPCAILAATTSRIATAVLEISVRNNLVKIAADKAYELETFAHERMRDAITLARSPEVMRTIDRLSASLKTPSVGSPAAPDQQTATIDIDSEDFLRYAAESADYSELLLIDRSGRIVYSLHDTFQAGASVADGNLSGSELAASFDLASSLLQSHLAPPRPYAATRGHLAFVTSPVLEKGRLIGVLALGFGPKRLWDLLSDWSGLGETGEIVAAEIVGQHAVVTNPLRHTPSAAFRLEIPLGGYRAIGTQRSVRGETGEGLVVDYRGKSVVASWCYLPSFRWGLNVKQDQSEAYGLLDFYRATIFWLSMATTLGVTLAAIAVAQTISGPIRTAVGVARQVAGGDLRASVGTISNDETGALLTAIQTMTSDLRGLIGRIQKASVALISTATAMQATGAEQQQVMADYGASTSQAVAAVKQISVTSQELVRTMIEVNDMAARTGEMATEGRMNLSVMDGTMRQLAETTGSFSSKLAIISERADHINLAVTTITKVADQTNLLSINAAIEAEKAGEYGLGFLVVAREIRRLADQTAVSSLDIERMVKEMQNSVSSGVMEMDRFAKQVTGGVREIGEISAKLGEIISAVQGISGRFGQVTEGMQAQSEGAEQIREAMVRLADGALRTAESLNQFHGATTHLREAVGDLKEEVSRFTI